jgi:hypothetical protein
LPVVPPLAPALTAAATAEAVKQYSGITGNDPGSIPYEEVRTLDPQTPIPKAQGMGAKPEDPTYLPPSHDAQKGVAKNVFMSKISHAGVPYVVRLRSGESSWTIPKSEKKWVEEPFPIEQPFKSGGRSFSAKISRSQGVAYVVDLSTGASFWNVPDALNQLQPGQLSNADAQQQQQIQRLGQNPRNITMRAVRNTGNRKTQRSKLNSRVIRANQKSLTEKQFETLKRGGSRKLRKNSKSKNHSAKKRSNL